VIKAMEEDPDLSLRGRVMARGGYTFSEIRNMSIEELTFLDFFQTKNEQDKLFSLRSILNEMIGYEWDLAAMKEAKEKAEGQPSQDKKMFRVPLTVAIAPQLLKSFEEETVATPFIGGGEYQPKAGEKVVSMASLSKEDFLKMVGGK